MEAETTGGSAGLSSSKRALLERLLRGKAAGNEPRPTIPRRNGEDPSPVSFAQQRLWFIHQLDPRSSAYIVASALRLRGGLVVPVLERALTELVGRHESLRTRFEAVEGTPVQVVDLPPERPPLTFIDLEPLPASKREEEASRLAAAEGAAPFDLARGPLFRAVLARLSVQEHVLLLTMHHIVSDAWSMGILVRELASLYAAFASGLPSPLEVLPIQYADFALWQRTRDDRERISREIDYWRGHLSPLPEALDLPADRLRPAVQTFRGGAEPVVFPTTEAEAMRRLGREEGATLYMVLLAALDALLARASGARDIVVGTGVANRTLPELEPIVGFFVNTLVLRVDCGGDPTFRELVCRSREAALGAFSHQEVPFERIVEELQPARDLGKNPLFQVLFELQNAPADGFETAGLSIEEVPTPRDAARFDLELHLWETPVGGLDGFLGYNADLFEPRTVRALAERFRGIVKAVAERPSTRLSDLCRLDGAERERVIGVWSGANRERPLESTLIGTFDRVVEERSRDVALVHEGGSMSYGQLSVRAKAVARLLAGKGMGLESRVGLAMDRSPDLVVAMLGIVGAGAAYVPIDAASPPERTARMLAEAGVSLVVTEGRAAVPSGAWKVVDYRNLEPATTVSAEERAGHEAAWPCPVSSLDRLAYVMFTSGSTGEPKGIEVTHQGVLRLVLGQDYVRFGPGETILQLAPAAFDASTFEIWGALLTGGRLAVAPAGIAATDEIARMLERFGVTTLWLTAGLFHVVVDEELATLARVPQVLAGGDVLSPAHVRRLLEAGAACVVNGYGPTESTTFACCHRLAAGDPIEGRVPIGRPIANTRVYVLDDAMEPVPPGMAGEIHLGGAGLARGYAGRPDLTAERFVPDPFGAPGSRLYRTGDVGRWHEEGRLEFLGRRDGQLKLRGYRVEIGEIEAAMASLPGVRGAVATARTARGGTEIVGFVVPDDAATREATDLRRSLAERLPGYMIPSRLVFIDGIPLTSNGKIDRRALSALDVEGAELERSSPSVPATPTERAVVDVWTDVLGGRPPGLDDDFFQSGGHSLLATRVVARLRTRLGVEVPLKTLFERPTVRGLAAWIDAAGGVLVQAGGGAIARARRDRPLPLSFAQQRLWFLDRLSPGLVAYNIPSVLRLEGRLDVSALERALGELVRRHEALRTRFTEGPDGPVQVIDDPGALSLPVVDLRGEPDADGEARRRITDEVLTPFDLARGSLVRAKLFKLADEDALFLLTLHHIVSDGWSMGVLVREVAALYEAFVSGRPSPLPELSIQYADFAVWQRERLSGERLEKELGWWRDRLTPLPPPVDLPADRPRPAVESFRGGAMRVAIPAEIAGALRAMATAEGATLFAALLTGWDALLLRLTGEDDIAVGTGIANRTHLEIEPLIGFFVNTLVLRVDCAGDPSYRELLRRVRDVALGAFAHQDLPFERLVEELQPTRDLARNPIFQVAFALQNMPQDGYELPGLTIGPFPFDGWTARFDLEMHLWDGAGGSLEGWLFYSADLFDETTIERTVARYVGLLASAVKRPEERLSRLCAEAPGEIETATRVLARGPLLSAPPRPALELFEEQVARRPGAPALVEGDRTLSYGELDDAAARLAAELRRGGVRRESRVAILADRSIEQVVAVLAAAKAGAPYVPLDPANPDGRLVSMLDRAGIDDLLVSYGQAERSAAKGRRVIGIEIASRLREGRAENVAHARGPDDLAYVIFTSGSTGEPQGVEVTQAGLANLVAWHIAAFGLTEVDRTTLVAGVGFDASVWELWPALASGACLLIPDEETRLDPVALRDWILARGVTSAFLPTPLAMLALALEWPQEGSLRTLLTGGDRLRPLGEARLPFRVVNNYGPTETAVVATSGELDTGASTRAPTIGRPIANAWTYVLDSRLRPVPIGVAGELFVGGAGVARGYAAAPGPTAARFLPDPWADVAGARMYRTGDRARLLEDGRIEFLGRVDQQVKVRGHRIEPAEIETVIAGHPSVASVAVVPTEEGGETRLIAYVTPRPNPARSAEWEDEHIDRWRRLYDETYGETPDSQDATFNITGWNSSYTGRPIDPEEMREWRDLTVERILAFGPRRVLEIGCGTGLLLSRLAPRCERYVATDFSSVSLDLVRRALAERRDCAHVELLERRADRFDGLEASSFDTVVINSVVQYFPDADYLERVIEGAMHAVAAGGRVFVGDVRDLRLHRAFAASVALHGEPRGELTAQARSRAEQIVAREEELLVAPRFFGAMARRERRGAWAEAQVKRGRADNELTRFRYDAVLHIGAAPEGVRAREVRWSEGGRGALEGLLGSEADAIRVRGIPNARIVADVAAARALEGGEPQAGQLPVLDLSPGAMHPDDAAALLPPGWVGTAHLSLEGEDLFDLLLVRSGGSEAAAATAALLPPPAGKGLLGPFTNVPLRATVAGLLAPTLRAYATERLPVSMVPAAFVVLETLPLTPNGKLDRRALPAPEARQSSQAGAPRSPEEEIACNLFAEVLGVARVGPRESFFELGGHSLLATRLVSRARTALGAEISLRAVFEAPTPAGFARAAAAARRTGDEPMPPLVRASDAERRKVSHEQLRRAPRAEAPPLPPLSYQQERLWFLDQLDASPAASQSLWAQPLTLLGALRLQGSLDAPALGRALDALAARHESLRTRFPAEAGVPRQAIDPPRTGLLEIGDLGAKPSPGNPVDIAISARLEDEVREGFDLAQGPLWRARLLRVGPEDHLFILSMHHIVTDGWSMSVLVRELGALYESFTSVRASDAASEDAAVVLPLQDLPIQYADYAVWQRRWLAEGELVRQRDWWLGRLTGIEPLELPTDRPRPSVQGHDGARVRARLDAALAQRLRALARAEGATLHMVLLAAFALVLGRWSGQDDVAVGTPVAGRTREETEGLIGFFVNTLVLRVPLAPPAGSDPDEAAPTRGPAFRALLGRVREAALGAYAHQDVPFESLLEALRPRRDLSRSPVFQVWFNFVNVPEEEPRFGALSVTPLGADTADAKFDLTLYAAESGDAIDLDAVYATDLFDAWRIEELLAQLEAVLVQAVTNPDVALEDISLVTARAHAALPDPEAELPADWHGAIHDLFARRASETPRALAIQDRGGSWTYAALDAHANRLARALTALGVRKGDPVAVFAHRSAPTVGAMLGILKAGAVIVMLDPAHPDARLRLCLEEAKPRALLEISAAGPLPEPLADFAGVARLALPDLEAWEDALGGFSDAPLEIVVGPDDPACLTFTSGSTGRPKGVLGRHGSLTHFQPYLESRFGIGPDDRFSMLSGLAHDPLQRDVFTPLAAGGAVIVPAPDDLDPARLAPWARASRLTVMMLTPAMAKVLAAGAEPGALPDLRALFFVGEMLARCDVEKLRAIAPAATLVNLYGTTETQRALGHFVMPAGGELRDSDGMPVARGSIPAGVGMPGAQLLVRRDGGAPVGLCERGEIWVRSPHLALGYLDTALTAEKFSGEGPARAYRTGDLGRYERGGIVAVEGRRDLQVNVRGFRVELGEVESALAAAPGVDGAVAALDREGHLVGYVTRAAGARPEPRAVREAVRARLPEPMVPAAVVVLETLPLTPNGKIDRMALPEASFAETGGYVPPRSPDEELCAALFAEVLDLPRVGATESFFDMGGHSLLATRLVARARTTIGVELSLRALFESPTPEGLARVVAAARRGGGAPPPPLVRASEEARASLSYAQRRLWFLDRLQPVSAVFNVPSAIRLAGDLDTAALARAFQALEARHESLRTRVTADAGEPKQIVDAPRPDPLSIVDLTGFPDPAAEAAPRVEGVLRAPFDLKRGPLWRATLFRVAAREHMLVVVLHHIVTDGWSMDLLAREVTALYEAFAEGREDPLTPLRIQYGDWAAWQRAWLEGGERERQLAWWRAELDGARPLDLPLDRPRPAQRGLRGAHADFRLPSTDAAAVARVARAEGATLFHALLACFQMLLARTAAVSDVVVGIPVANRTREESHALIGLFVNTLPIRQRVDADASLREIVRRVREKMIDALSRQDVPFETIVEAARVERDLSRNPLYDAMFAFRHVAGGERSNGGIELEPLPVDTGVSDFDLTLMMVESDGELLGTLIYDRDLFDAATAERLVGQFEALVRALGRDPDERLGDVVLSSPEERERIARANRTSVARADRTVVELFEDRAALDGKALAVLDEEGTLTYAQLDARAEAVARALRALDIGPEAGVALLAGRTCGSIAGMLGILKAGGVLVPLDPVLPAARLDTMLTAANVRAVVAERGLVIALAETRGKDLPVVSLSSMPDEEERPKHRAAAGFEGAARRSLPVRPENAAYVIFTSGSTGEPKGSIVEHRAIADRMLCRVAQMALCPGDRVLYFFSPVFDASLEEILPPLLTGAAIVVHPDPKGETPADWITRVAHGGVTVAHLPVGFLNELADDLERDGVVLPASLRIVVMGGEAPSGARLAALLRAGGGRLTVTNAYGPTEAVVEVTTHDLVDPEESRDPVPIGAPLDNTVVHLLDARLRPVPYGAFGEVFIGGPVLARGYAARPAETAAAFIPDPFSAHPGARLYRTGDRARYREDGALVFAGRRDGQIKIRGFRVELAEVEAALLRAPGVRDAAVLVRGEGSRALLAAFVVPATPLPLETGTVRDALRERLPEYMVPREIVPIQELPRTAGGKVDRRALLALGVRERTGRRTPPRDEHERSLAALWRETLGTTEDDVHESFFDAGGNSLLAVRLVASIRRALGRELPVADVFRRPTIAAIARALRSEDGGESPDLDLVTLRAGGGLPPLVCIHDIGGGIAPFAALAAHLDPGRPVLGLQALDGRQQGSLEDIASVLAPSIARAIPEGPVHLLGWSYGALLAYEIASWLRAAGREVGTLVLLDAAAPPSGTSNTETRRSPLRGATTVAHAARALWGIEIGRSDATSAIEAARAAGALPDDLTDADAHTWLSNIAARLDAADRYRALSYEGDAVLVRGTESTLDDTRGEALGWDALVQGRLSVEWAPGSHYSMAGAEEGRVLAAIVERHIGKQGGTAAKGLRTAKDRQRSGTDAHDGAGSRQRSHDGDEHLPLA